MSTKYKYSNIKDISQAENYNFYGIIYDASFPSTDDTPNTYVCNVKLIDTDTNCLTFPSSLNDEIVTLIIKSNTKENLPYIHNVGDIMRIHRGHYVSIVLIPLIYFLNIVKLIFRSLKRRRRFILLFQIQVRSRLVGVFFLELLTSAVEIILLLELPLIITLLKIRINKKLIILDHLLKFILKKNDL